MDTPTYTGSAVIGGTNQQVLLAKGSALADTLITRQSGSLALTCVGADGTTAFDLTSLTSLDCKVKPYNSAETPVTLGTGVISGGDNNIYTVSWVKDKIPAGWSTYASDRDGAIVLWVEFEETGTADFYQVGTRFNIEDGDFSGDATVQPLVSLIYYYNPAWQYDNTTTDADPTAGKFRLDSTTLASVTEMYIADTPQQGMDLQTMLQGATTGTNIYIGNPNVKLEGAYFTVSGAITNNTDYSTIPLTFVSAGTSQFTNESIFSFNIDRSGAATEYADGESIDDDSSNELITFGVTASAVNNVKISNQATGSAPKVESIGDDTNINLELEAKGTGSVVLNSDLDAGDAQAIKNLLNLDITNYSELTISSGAVTATQLYHSVDTEGDASTDDLDTVTLGDSNLIFLRLENASRVVTLKDGTGNLAIGADIEMEVDKVYFLLYNGTAWEVVGGTGSGGGSLGSLSDVNITSEAQGDILYRNGSEWVNLGFGTSGQFLQTQGSGANPQWSTPAGSGDVSGPASAVDENLAVFDSTTGKLIKDATVNISAVTANTAKLTADETNVVSALDGATLTAVTVAGTDKVIIQDISDSDNIKTVTAQSIADLGSGGTDADAIHDNVANEITAITEKTSVSALDEYVQEDSDASFVKKSIKHKTLVQAVPTTETGTTYTLEIDDIDVTMNNASANVVTIPTNTSIAYPVNTVISITQLGAGATTITGDTGVTVNGVSAGSIVIGSQYGATVLTKTATDTWVATVGGSGSGDVVGPASSTDNALARFDSTTGKLLQNGIITQDDLGNLSGVVKIDTGTKVAIGQSAGQTTQGDNAVAIAYQAGESTQGSQAVAVGYRAGQTTQGDTAVAVGYRAGQTTQGDQTVAVGYLAGNNTQGNQATAMGYLAGNATQGASATAVGREAGRTSQGANAVAMGNQSATTTQGDNAVAVGLQAGNTSQGANSVAVGRQAGQTSQGTNAVAVGYLAGGTGTNEINIGYNVTGNGANTVSIGNNSITENYFNGVLVLVENSGPSTPASGEVSIGVDDDGDLLTKNSAGEERLALTNAVDSDATTTVTLADTDFGKTIYCDNAGAISVVLNTGLKAGFFVNIVQQGAGACTVSGTATREAPNGVATTAQYEMLQIRYRTTDTYNIQLI